MGRSGKVAAPPPSKLFSHPTLHESSSKIDLGKAAALSPTVVVNYRSLTHPPPPTLLLSLSLSLLKEKKRLESKQGWRGRAYIDKSSQRQLTWTPMPLLHIQLSLSLSLLKERKKVESNREGGGAPCFC